MPQNDFLVFANASNANVLSQADYLALASVRSGGFLSGTARSPQLNKVWRQSSAIASMVAAFATANSNQDMLDNGDQNAQLNAFTTALRRQPYMRAPQSPADPVNYVGAYAPVVTGLLDGLVLSLFATAANAGAASFTPNVALFPGVPILRLSGQPLRANDILAGRWINLQYNALANAWFILNAAPSSSIHAGVMMQQGMLNVPDGWLLCDGSAILRATYSDLFSAIGVTWGAGNGSTTFNIPDMRGYFSRGFGVNGDGTASGGFAAKQAADVLRHNHTATINDPGHLHNISDPGHGHSVNDPGHFHQAAIYAHQDNGPLLGNANGGPSGTMTTDTRGTGISIAARATGVGVIGNTTGVSASIGLTGNENRPANIALPWIIKV